MFLRIIYFLGFGMLFFGSCTNEPKPAEAVPQFELLKKEDTGLNFKNEVYSSIDFNVFDYMYFFNGGGVAAGDFNQDGKVDLFFTSNMSPNKLFLNEGDFKFKDVTEIAGMKGLDGWTSGTSVVDINNDGLLDIYVCQVGGYRFLEGQNQLYICITTWMAIWTSTYSIILYIKMALLDAGKLLLKVILPPEIDFIKITMRSLLM